MHQPAGIDEIQQLRAPLTRPDVEQAGGRCPAGFGGALAGEPVGDEILGGEKTRRALEMIRFVLPQP